MLEEVRNRVPEEVRNRLRELLKGQAKYVLKSKGMSEESRREEMKFIEEMMSMLGEREVREGNDGPEGR